jgi:MFS transporter, MHS family, proline/betaine transporter
LCIELFGLLFAHGEFLGLFSVYLGQLLGESYSNNLLIAVVLLVLITVPLPYFGKLADKIDNKKLLIYSMLGIIALLYPLSIAIANDQVVLLGIALFLFCILFTVLSTLIPFLLPDLFPTRVRFTCVGVAFNVADATLGSFTPVISMYLVYFTNRQESFCWYLLFCAALSLLAYLTLPKKNHSLH